MNTLYRFVIGLVIIVNCLPGIAQTNISGDVNDYAKVVNIHTADSITVDNSSGFKDGDTVMIIQMKGADFDLSKFNNIVNIKGTGRYEFIIIQHISGTHIKFLSNLINTYDDAEALQLVRVPYYQYAKVSFDLTCQSWDGNKGGVIALIVGDTLELNANIDASSKGFPGGNRTTASTTTCHQLKDSLNYQESAIDRAGLKGGGIGNMSYPYTRGRGAIGNAAGGGNGFGAGGGGGSGYGSGGNGGRASSTYCAVNDSLGGYGGKIPIDYYAGNTSDKRDRIFMGGGGGSSRGLNNDATNGGAGGAIVFIITNHLKTNNYYIRSNGESLPITTVAIDTAGAGGGGGGGTILLALEKLTGQLNVEAKGGKGGNADHCSGQGGGGGGGFVWFSGKSLNFGALTFGGGLCGVSTIGGCPPNSLATNGSPGDSTNRLNPVLNGFLFNVIGKAQTICYGDIPQRIVGTTPRGGNGTYTYQWQKRTRTIPWNIISGANQKDYSSLLALTDSTYFRRIVTSATFVDTSKSVIINVIPAINSNSIAPDTAICYGQNLITLRGSMPSNGDGTFAYAWEESLDNISWSNAGGIDSLIDYYKYGFFNSTKYFRRIVRSGYLDCCKDTSNSVKVTVQPEIQNNNIVSNQEICNAQTPAQLIQGSGTLTGGNGPFTFLWQQRPIDFLSWSDVTELGNQLNYQPSSLNKTTYYRRKAMSGVCISYSDSVTITALSLLTGNTLSGNPEVCEGKVPDIITGGNMSGGHPGDYRYVWQDSVSNGLWNNLSNAQDKDYIPNNLSQKTYFRRIVKSGDNDCCVSTSDPFAIIINLLPIGIFECHDTAICQGNNINAKLTITSGTAPFEAKLTEGTYQETITGLPQGLSNINFIPRQTGTYSVFSITDNKGCLAVSKDGSMKIRIVAVPKVVAGESAIVEGKTHQLVEISNISIGRWSTELPSTFQPSDTTPNAIVTVEKCGTHHFIWKETNEFCWDTASVEIIFWMRYTGFSPNNDGFNDYFVIEGLDNIRKELIVVNRWGNEVYSSDNYENNWDGTNQKGKPLPDDTYYYILKINGYKVYKGFIVIRR